MVAGIGGIWAPAALRLARTAASKASNAIRTKLAQAARPVNTALEPALARATPRQPVHPAALLRQQKSRRWHSTSTYRNINTAVRRFISTGRLSAPRVDRTKFQQTNVGRGFAQFTGRAPFASTLRPNLTGGALPRTAGGYGLGSGGAGGARYFSHTPVSHAEVVQNVSAAVRAFWISGQKAQFNGLNAQGEHRYRAVSALQDKTMRKMGAFPRNTPGAYVDFRLSPTVTALSPLTAALPFKMAGTRVDADDATTLNTEGFLDVLSADFGHALKELTATLADIKKLSSLGDLSIRLEKADVLRVRFPGVDADTVETLCNDLGLTRGTVSEDDDFESENGVFMALRFPYAPGVTNEEASSASDSLTSSDRLPAEELFEEFSEIEENPWLTASGPEGYESMPASPSTGTHCSEDFEGLDGVYKFLEECDRAQGRF